MLKSRLCLIVKVYEAEPLWVGFQAEPGTRGWSLSFQALPGMLKSRLCLTVKVYEAEPLWVGFQAEPGTRG